MLGALVGCRIQRAFGSELLVRAVCAYGMLEATSELVRLRTLRQSWVGTRHFLVLVYSLLRLFVGVTTKFEVIDPLAHRYRFFS